tara:strand:- start:4866 stop:5564 length:699 start_codon:yes stop_codon:yes gene_type:complete
MSIDPYQTLGVSPLATRKEIQIAYRELVKKHHPDAGGDKQRILAVNAAWNILRDKEHRLAYDQKNQSNSALYQEAQARGMRNARASAAAQQAQGQSAAEEDALLKWLTEVYNPIDRLLGQVINPFSKRLQELSADPYDDELMEAFCSYLEQSQKKLVKIEQIYRSMPTPITAQGFGLSLYHCLSQVQDAFNEIERYTMGYVDNYLHDGREMLREAKKRRSRLKQERLRLKLS